MRCKVLLATDTNSPPPPPKKKKSTAFADARSVCDSWRFYLPFRITRAESRGIKSSIEQRKCVDPVVLGDKPPPLAGYRCIITTAAPSAECKFSVDVGDRQTDTHRHRLKPPSHDCVTLCPLYSGSGRMLSLQQPILTE